MITSVLERPATQDCGVADLGRSVAVSRWSPPGYGDPMPRSDQPPTAWASYLIEVQGRQGWSVARIARESEGRISRSTLFRMISGETQRVPLDVVRLVASIVGDDPDEVIARVAGSVDQGEASAPADGRLAGLDPNDPVVRHILDMHVPDDLRVVMLARYRHLTELRRQRDIAEFELMAFGEGA